MKQSDDERAMMMLEKAVYHAKDLLEETKHFNPFSMVMTDTEEIEFYENKEKDTLQSYALLEEGLRVRIKKGNVNISVLAVDTKIPDKFVKEIAMGIRIHIEEKSQIDKKISAKYIYVPYELCRVGEGEMFVKLHTPHAVGFPAEYIVKEGE